MTELEFAKREECMWSDAQDGTCAHPDNMTPECHEYACPLQEEADDANDPD